MYVSKSALPQFRLFLFKSNSLIQIVFVQIRCSFLNSYLFRLCFFKYDVPRWLYLSKSIIHFVFAKIRCSAMLVLSKSVVLLFRLILSKSVIRRFKLCLNVQIRYSLNWDCVYPNVLFVDSNCVGSSVLFLHSECLCPNPLFVF